MSLNLAGALNCLFNITLTLYRWSGQFRCKSSVSDIIIIIINIGKPIGLSLSVAKENSYYFYYERVMNRCTQRTTQSMCEINWSTYIPSEKAITRCLSTTVDYK